MHTVTKRQQWVGRILSGIPVLFLLMDGVGKLVAPPQVVEGTQQLGYPTSAILPMGVLVLIGARDPATKPQDGELIASSIADAQKRVLDAAHISNIEQPEAFTSVVLEFLSQP